MSNDCNALFSFKACFFKREFKGQSSGPHIGDKLISGNELTTVMDTVYESCEEHLQREGIFSMIGNYREVVWSQNIRPESSDIHKYILFHKYKIDPNYYKRFEELEMQRHWYSYSHSFSQFIVKLEL